MHNSRLSYAEMYCLRGHSFESARHNMSIVSMLSRTAPSALIAGLILATPALYCPTRSPRLGGLGFEGGGPEDESSSESSNRLLR